MVEWFDQGGAIKVSPRERSEIVLQGFSTIPGLVGAVEQTGLAPKRDAATVVAACELILEGLVAHQRISRSEELGYARARGRPGGMGGQTDLGGGQQLVG